MKIGVVNQIFLSLFLCIHLRVFVYSNANIECKFAFENAIVVNLYTALTVNNSTHYTDPTFQFVDNDTTTKELNPNKN